MGKLYSALLTLSIIWGTSFLFIKMMAPELGPWGVVFWRCLFGFVTLLCVMLIRKERIQWEQLPFGWIFLVGLINNVLPFGFIAIGELKISSSMASVINAMTPISTVIIGVLLFAAHIRKMQWIGILLGFTGILILLQFDVTQLVSGSLQGILFVLAATFCYALGTHLSRKYLSHLSVTVLSASTLLMASVISFLFMTFMSTEGFRGIHSYDILLSLGGLGIFGSGLAYLLFYYMVKEGSAEFATFVTYLVPVSAMIWGNIILGEKITYHMIFGLVLIFTGVYLSTFSQRKKSSLDKTAA
ncbi:DMT family transporter [Bacillus sp. 165]|uniref:DMT family transporter n=1 Tax=Bacillus sp. 165 TaxID=1529117 RepID=UPI001ADA92F0|nr:DMT family transporter [Bacillus sp. 165]MBO9130337.1 DMT family transporter [Bacillus sp. 165]